MKTKRPIRRLLALHEAGHAIAAAVLGATSGYVTIRPTSGTLGHCHMPIPNGDSFSYGVVDVAGIVATELVLPGGADRLARHSCSFMRPHDIPPVTGVDGGLGDMGMIAAHVKVDRLIRGDDPDATPTEDVDDFVRRCAARAAELLADHWRALEVLADELFTFGTVEASRVVELVESHRKEIRSDVDQAAKRNDLTAAAGALPAAS